MKERVLATPFLLDSPHVSEKNTLVKVQGDFCLIF
ncbi:hypothetical protein SAMN05428975_0439 [Mucilaginibacter sp. OK268]|nr:hypothetical protein SAMN05428975_0439 [Mucilaginibacter sp. OK268]